MKNYARQLFLSGFLSLLFCLILVQTSAADPFERRREYLVSEYVEKEGITNPRVLESMRKTERHLFVPLSARDKAYTDQALSIGHEQTISPPFIVAYMTEILEPQETDRVLEIGTGSGYQAAVLSPLVKDVYTIEIVEPLGRRAASTLKRLRYENVHTRIGDGFKGWPEAAPFDKIIVTCSPESIPQPLIDQLKDGGKMIIPLGERYQQVFYLLEKKDGKMISRPLQPTLFVPMTGLSEEQRRVLPDPSNPQLINGSFETDDNGDGYVDGFHYQRQMTRIEGDAPDGEYYVLFDNPQPGQLAQMLQGFAIDGRSVSELRISVEILMEEWRIGLNAQQRPGMVIHYYDEDRRPLGSDAIGLWHSDSDWQQLEYRVAVPYKAREAIVQIGLNGAAGKLAIDNVVLRRSK
ncbi:protein-L-isoaspartate(D-aspartate) O-methyltransferase [Rubinisphaera margarita]|uniref:protein-L-isoaspartate(D-aspartate) O-methyltransferase n=1 Tax=Rubinisphaera margarita TaxID=2909586 RepID=UPI001EE8B679|nr:protein-L-isoaspartate(D-aspartate) O-methyltransferase [Rubinisphaera margarita]MCG6156008.1 protein-L-isoaspartate(D-aspartate) O-methyltransferase [Rubinisphaera margarita]